MLKPVSGRSDVRLIVVDEIVIAASFQNSRNSVDQFGSVQYGRSLGLRECADSHTPRRGWHCGRGEVAR
jgi:hypothetical protein